ncbi:MAG: TetR/AcrR family transcriptional regulator [Defluviitaleaceae bacterium]|nr:TetR/AcrR family transcriptional regulator [Defluviitaleaceae bacterium]
MKKNYYNTSIYDIVTEADVSIGTFYNYFPDKISMYKYVVLKHGQDIRKFIAKGLSKTGITDRKKMEREGIKLYLDYCLKNPRVINIIWQSHFVAPELFIAYYDNFGKQYEKQLASAVAVGEVYPADLEVVSYMLMGMSNFLAIKYVEFGDHNNLTDERLYEIVDQVMEILQRGMFV